MTDLIVFIRDNIDDDPNLLSTITNNMDKPEHEKLLKAYSEYMRKYGRDYEKNNVRTDVEDFRKITDAVQAFKSLMDDDDDVDLFDLNDNDNVNDDNLDSLILNNEEDLNDEMLFPNDTFGQDYNYLDSIGLSSYLQDAFAYTHARKQSGYKRNKLDDDVDAKLAELHNITKSIKTKVSRSENYNKEKYDLQRIKSYFNQLMKIRHPKELNQDIKRKVFTSTKEVMDDNNSFYDMNQSMFYDEQPTIEFSDIKGNGEEDEVDDIFGLGEQELILPGPKATQIDGDLDMQEQDNIRRAYEQARLNRGISAKRAGKDYSRVKSSVDAFQNLNISKQIDTGKFKKTFLDLIINGNYRIKYIPGASTRDLAEEYCKKHLDPDGVPLYRLLPVNATDPLGNPITDLNGDQVDDIVLVNKKGIPSIVNGYKLVYASPYKKVWQSTFTSKEARLATPFNAWMNEMFQKSIDNVNWDEGKYILTPNENIQRLTAAYTNVGLPKPRVSKRLTPNSFWASIFSHVWADFWNHKPKLEPLKKLFKYLQVANAIYIAVCDTAVKEQIEQTVFKGTQMKYDEWVMYKKGHMKEYNTIAAPILTELNRAVLDFIDPKTNQRKKNPVQNPEDNTLDKNYMTLLYDLELIIFAVGLEYNPKTDMEKILVVCNNVLTKPKKVPAVRENISKRIDNYIENYLYGANSGYIQMKEEHKTTKSAREAAAGRYNVLFAPPPPPQQQQQQQVPQ